MVDELKTSSQLEEILMSFLFEISLIVILIGFANSSIGVFLVLNDKSMISFALSHSVLLGIIISYGIIPDLYSPIFIIISSIIGFIIVGIVELLNKVKFIEYNSALGFVYLTVFAISIILISTNNLDIYYSLESIVSGQLLYLPFFPNHIFGYRFTFNSLDNDFSNNFKYYIYNFDMERITLLLHLTHFMRNSMVSQLN